MGPKRGINVSFLCLLREKSSATGLHGLDPRKQAFYVFGSQQNLLVEDICQVRI